MESLLYFIENKNKSRHLNVSHYLQCMITCTIYPSNCYGKLHKLNRINFTSAMSLFISTNFHNICARRYAGAVTHAVGTGARCAQCTRRRHAAREGLHVALRSRCRRGSRDGARQLIFHRLFPNPRTHDSPYAPTLPNH